MIVDGSSTHGVFGLVSEHWGVGMDAGHSGDWSLHVIGLYAAVTVRFGD